MHQIIRQFAPIAVIGTIGVGIMYRYSSGVEQHKKIFIFFESHSDPAPAKIMRELLPFFNQKKVKTFCAEQPITETKEYTIQANLLAKQKVKSLIEKNEKPDAEMYQYSQYLVAMDEYINFLQALSKYSITFKAVDMPYKAILEEQTAATPERNQFMVDNIIKSDVENDLLMLVGLHHIEIACKLRMQGYQVYSYYTPSKQIGEDSSPVDYMVRPKNKEHTKIYKAKMECDDKYFVVLNVIDTSLNNKLNARHMIIEDYYQENVLHGDASMHDHNEL